MPSINSIAVYFSAIGSEYEKSNLRKETFNKLKALGIDVSSVSSETEAKKLIVAKEDTKTSEKEQNVKTNTTEEEALLTDIKNLARKLGITVNSNDKISNIFQDITSNIEALSQNTYNPNLNIFMSELDILKNKFKNMYSGETALLSAMEMISKVNKAEMNMK